MGDGGTAGCQQKGEQKSKTKYFFHLVLSDMTDDSRLLVLDFIAPIPTGLYGTKWYFVLLDSIRR